MLSSIKQVIAMHVLYARDAAGLCNSFVICGQHDEKFLLPGGYTCTCNYRWGGCLLAAITSCNSTLDPFRRLLPPSVVAHDPGSGILNCHGQYTAACGENLSHVGRQPESPPE